MINQEKIFRIRNAKDPNIFAVVEDENRLSHNQVVIIGKPSEPDTWFLGVIDLENLSFKDVLVDVYGRNGCLVRTHFFNQEDGALNHRDRRSGYKIASLDETFSNIINQGAE